MKKGIVLGMTFVLVATLGIGLYLARNLGAPNFYGKKSLKRPPRVSTSVQTVDKSKPLAIRIVTTISRDIPREVQRGASATVKVKLIHRQEINGKRPDDPSVSTADRILANDIERRLVSQCALAITDFDISPKDPIAPDRNNVLAWDIVPRKHGTKRGRIQPVLLVQNGLKGKELTINGRRLRIEQT